MRVRYSSHCVTRSGGKRYRRPAAAGEDGARVPAMRAPFSPAAAGRRLVFTRGRRARAAEEIRDADADAVEDAERRRHEKLRGGVGTGREDGGDDEDDDDRIADPRDQHAMRDDAEAREEERDDRQLERDAEGEQHARGERQVLADADLRRDPDRAVLLEEEGIADRED